MIIWNFNQRIVMANKLKKVATVPMHNYVVTLGGTGHLSDEPPVMAEVLTLADGSGTSGVRRGQGARRRLPLRKEHISAALADSGSDDGSSDSDDENLMQFDYGFRETTRHTVNRLRQQVITRDESVEEGLGEEWMGNDVEEGLGDGWIGNDVKEGLGDGRMGNVMRMNNDMMNEGALGPGNVSTEFLWSDDFTSFSSRKETYRRDPGPTISSTEPVDLFLAFWDEHIMSLIAHQTNIYARQYIEYFTDPDFCTEIPRYLEKWEEVTVSVLYRYFAMLIYMSFCVRTKVQEYWENGSLEMPIFKKIMSRDYFLLITKFLHFVSDKESSAHGYSRKIGKIVPILDHCNRKFSELYIPEQHISLDESLLLWKGRLSWRQCIRSKAARFGIKSFELCEASSGYLLKCKLYTGKETPMHTEPIHGFSNKTAQVVLDLMERYLDVGHILVMDNWYNQLSLTRFLKSRGTDVLGTINRNRKDVPQDLKDLKPDQVPRGDWYARHCGDIALVTWKDVQLVTVMCTYHDHVMVPGSRAGVARMKPISVVDYNRYKGGVDLKDQKMSIFLFERRGCRKWYMKVFRRLLNNSLLNAYIIHTKTPLCRLPSHREFRRNVADGLVARFGVTPAPPSVSLPNTVLRLQSGNHFPVHTEMVPNKNEHRKLSCVRCKMLKKRTQIRLMCSLCKVPLCIGKCWLEYHTRENLSTTA